MATQGPDCLSLQIDISNAFSSVSWQSICKAFDKAGGVIGMTAGFFRLMYCDAAPAVVLPSTKGERRDAKAPRVPMGDISIRAQDPGHQGGRAGSAVRHGLRLEDRGVAWRIFQGCVLVSGKYHSRMLPPAVT
jgi:hypothetical protein